MKKFKICMICLFVFGGWYMKAQLKAYMDPLVSGALFSGEMSLKKEQNKTSVQQALLLIAQGLTTTQIEGVNSTQGKLYNGLKNVPSIVKDLNTVEQIRTGVSDCYSYITEISKLVKKYPDYKEYQKYANEYVLKQAIDIGADLESVLTSGSDNLATAGDRYKLVFNISEKVDSVKRLLYNIKTKIELGGQIDEAYQRRNEKILTNYTNIDREIIEAVMAEYKDKF